MRWICLPEELALPHLLELQDVPTPQRHLLAQLKVRLKEGAFESALTLAEQAYALAYRTPHRVSEALALLFRADIYRRMHHWEDALDAIHYALRWLEHQVSPVARYNEAVSVYVEGLVHATLQADQKVLETFAYAHQGLVASEQHWVFEQNMDRAADSRSVRRWMSQILDKQTTTLSSEISLLLPVYELVDDRSVCTDVVVLQPFQVTIPSDVMARYLPANYVPVQMDALPFLQLDPQVSYFAVRIPEDGYILRTACRGDLLIVEATTPELSEGGLTLTSDKPFVRQDDDRVAFRPAVRNGEQSAKGLAGIPRLLIKGGEDV